MSELRGSNGDFTPTQNALLVEAGEFNPQGWLKFIMICAEKHGSI
ncbi:MAG: hypothetical protein QNJ63_04885 [Calothrix sp. MO_192.B10]|nr:hypothetical protein [Calothrix sp. MO_192.B10]